MLTREGVYPADVGLAIGQLLEEAPLRYPFDAPPGHTAWITDDDLAQLRARLTL